MADDTSTPHCTDKEVNEIRFVLNQIADKWSIMILTILCPGPTRFNAIKRGIGEITHKSLTDALRRLERVGLIRREVIASSPVAVQYELTELGRTLEGPFSSILEWSKQHAHEIITAQKKFEHVE
ncbi:helix-turn-helix transcriptional regulator [Dickeya fangzhongdai]|uniref:winged helix-turn-helix transcriptional regulator n=1 Tax=Dickeya fangzhongdai TaxID=1778540 RepID=UPI0005732E9C|nr:helix-turn-helix domain-containing protein [Dickeya fangzhongdai]KHN52245.1 HxlR family transcriptional regulator [Dickeya fangzhongdai]WPD77296.1 helix-turn-helix transcriptional regulator [Dickeya fangzhongdai]